MRFGQGRRWVRLDVRRFWAIGAVLALLAGVLVGGAGTSQAAATTYLQVDAFAATAFTGQTVDFRVRARDDVGNVDPAYRGTVHFTSSDPGAVLPPDYTFTAADNGDHTFTGLVAFAAPGNQVVTLADVAAAAVRGDSRSILVSASVVTYLQVDAAGGNNTAGVPIGVRVRARSDRGDVVPGYRGTIHFTSTDPAATLPLDYTFTAADNGDHTFSNGLRYATAGNQSISAADTTTPGIRGDSADTLVFTTGATQLDVDTSGGNTAGQPLTIRVRPRDDNGNVDTGYRGTIHFTSTDPAATLPADYTFTAGDNGDHTFSTGAKYATAGNQSVTAVDTARPAVRGDSFSTFVYPPAGTYLDVDTSTNSVTAGEPMTLRIRVRNERGDLDAGYRGTVRVTSTDAGATLPVDYTFTAADSGDKSFTNGLRYATPGNQSVSAAEVARPALRGDSTSTLVYARPATYLEVTTASTASPGQANTLRVRARNDRGDIDTGYRGTVHFTSTDPGATLPADYTFTAGDNGDHTFSAVAFATAGNQSVAAVDAATPAVRGRSAPTRVGSVAVLAVDVFDETPTAGQPGTVRVTALTPAGVTDDAYRGTVRLTSTDPSMTLPADYTFTAADNGRHDFPALAFVTAGTQTVDAADTADPARRGSDTVYVLPAAATYLEVQVFASEITAGHPVTLRVRARNADGVIDAGYRGTVRVTSNDPAATLPADYTFTAADAGEHTFTNGVTYVTPGNRAVAVADTARPTLRGDSGSTLVKTAAAAYLEVQVFSSSLSAGEPATLRIRARNENGDIDTGYRGTVRVASSDAAAGLPANYTFTAGDLGERTFTNGVTYNTPGSQSVSAVDTANASVRGDSGPTLVLYTGATHLEVQLFASEITAGHPVSGRIRARNANGDIDTGYRGTVHFTSTDAGAGAARPADHTFTAGDAGEFSFTDGVVFTTTGAQRVSAADVARPVRGDSGAVLVLPSAATHLDVEAFVSTAAPGVPFDVRITARNDHGDIDTAYRGTVHFTSTDPAAVLPADYTFTAGDAGRRTITDAASLATSGSQIVGAADTAPGSTVRGFSSAIVVPAGPPVTTTSTSTSTTSTSTTTTSSTTTTTAPPNLATHFDVEVFASQITAGVPVDVRVTARDAGNAIATGYRGTVHLTSTDAGAVLAGDVTFTAGDSGRRTFTGGVRFGTAGNQRVTATDTVSPSITGQSAAVLVFLPDATHFDVEIFTGTVTTGQAVDVRVTARNDNNDIDQGYRGTVSFTSTDSGATVPVNYTFTATDAGRRTFTAGVAFATAGAQRVSATETARPSVTGTSGPVTVQAAVATHFVVSPSASTATAGQPVGVQVTAVRADASTDTAYAGTVHFTSTDSAATLPADYTFAAGDAGRRTFSPGVTFQTSGNQTVTVTAVGSPSVTGTSTAVLVNAPPPSTTTSSSTSSTTSTSSTSTTSSSTTTTVPSGTTTTKPPCTPPTVNVQPSTMRAGDVATVSGCGFGANKTVQINMFSTPVFLGETTANGSGIYSIFVVIPPDAAPGNHTIVASGLNGQSAASEGSTGIFISGPPLPDTDPGPTVPPTTAPPTTTTPPTTAPPTTAPPTTSPGTTVPAAAGDTGNGTGAPTGGDGAGTGTDAGTGTGTGAGVGNNTGGGTIGTGAGVGTGAATGAGTGTAGGASGGTTGGVSGSGQVPGAGAGQTPAGSAAAGGTNPAGGGTNPAGGTAGGPAGGSPAGGNAGAGTALGAPGGTQAAQAGAGTPPAPGRSSTGALLPRPGFEQQSELVTAVPTPADVSTDARTIGANVLLALALILLIGFPADIFNSTLAEHYDEVSGWFRFARRRRTVVEKGPGWFDRLPTFVRLGVFGLIGSVLYGLLDPNFGFNRPSLILVLGLLLAIGTISTVLDVLRMHYHRRITRKHGRLKAFPIGIAMAAILVFFSRIGHFHPGYVFGIFTALAFEDELYDEEDGRGLAIAGVGLLVVAIAALFLRAPLDRLAGADGASFGVLVVDAALATLWIAGIQAVIWGLVPISFMYGQKVLVWNKLGWLAIYGTGMLLFVHTLLHPGMGLYGSSSEASLVSVTLLFVSFGAFSLLFWAYFRFRKPRSPATPAPVSVDATVGRPVLTDGAVSRFDAPPS